MKGKRFFPKRSILFISVLSLFLIPTFSYGATFCVSNATELQSALTIAENTGEDNTIQIVQGTYNGNFIYASTEAYGLTVEGGYAEGCASRTIDPANTILDGGGTDMVLALVSQGAAVFSVEGLTLQNGNASTVTMGGGLYAKTEDGAITLSNNTFTGNSGGGAYVSGTATLTNNTFAENTASSNYGCGGGGAYIVGPATLTNNTFTENTVTNYKYSVFGGGACVYGASTLTDNTFTGNKANGIGGGAYVVDGTLTNNTFTGNTSGDSGGGAYITRSSTSTAICTLTDNTFTENTTSRSGGGVYIYGAHTITNNIFTGNTANTNGGGLCINSNVNATLTNNTLTSNTTDGEGGGVWLAITNNDYSGYLYNNIIWSNTATTGNDLYINNTGEDPFFPVTVNLFNNDFDQGASGTYIAEPFTIDPSNLDNEDPLFVGSGNYHLTASSPCINTGDNDAPDLPSTDKDGNPRIMGGTVDMGAYEFVATVYAAPDGACGGNTPCYSTIQAAIDAADTESIIRILQGIFDEDVIIDQTYVLTFSGGWDSTFTTQSSNTVINSLTITGTSGTVEIENVVLQ